MYIYVYLIENEQQHQDVDIHPCTFKQHFYEFRLKRTALQFIKVINNCRNMNSIEIEK